MTQHFFDHSLATLSYYKFGKGEQKMLCFHGYGMHGRQFRVLEELLGSKFTFYGFDLFFHEATKLKNHTLEVVKEGLSKQELAGLIMDFCRHERIDRFSVIGYSMGSHYATTVVEELPQLVDEYIVVAPSSLNPGRMVRFLSKNKLGNGLLEKLVLSKKALIRLLKVCQALRVVDRSGYEILYKEIATAELRFNFYACFTYLRFLETNESRLLEVLQEKKIRSVFIFGKRDLMYPPTIGNKFISQLQHAEVLVLDENHEMVNRNFAQALSKTLSEIRA